MQKNIFKGINAYADFYLFQQGNSNQMNIVQFLYAVPFNE